MIIPNCLTSFIIHQDKKTEVRAVLRGKMWSSISHVKEVQKGVGDMSRAQGYVLIKRDVESLVLGGNYDCKSKGDLLGKV